MMRALFRSSRAALALWAALPAGAETGPVVPHFVEETATSGLTATYSGAWQYIVGGGIAAFDCAHDGRPSVLVAGGDGRAKFFRNASRIGGALDFREAASGLELAEVTGAYPIDIDGDGEVDLVLLRVGEIALMRGLGQCRFERANERWGFDGGDAWWTSFSAVWENGADWPTLAFGAYFDRRNELEPWGTCTPNLLFRPRVADGAGQRKFAAPEPLIPSFCALSMLFSDWNRSGIKSLRVSNDREYYKGGQEQMWHIRPGEAPRLYTEAEGWKYLRVWGMGIASYDLSGSGYPDYFLTSMADSKLQRLDPPRPGAPAAPSYTDIAYARGVTAHRPYTGGDTHPSTGWHAQFEDINNDGLADLFIAKGNVSEMPDFAKKDPNNLLVQRPDGKFDEMGDVAGIASFAPARGAALADFNLSGAISLIVVNRNEPAQVFRNDTRDLGRWLGVRLDMPGANRNGIGAWIEVRADGKLMRRELTIGGGHAGGQLGWTHFGLGTTSGAEIRVIWPDGAVGDWQGVEANRFYVLAPGAAPRQWIPAE